MKTYTICGSMRFQKEMQEVAYYLETKKNYNVLQCVYTFDDYKTTKEELRRLELAHYKKIDLSDGIYVLNINGYIGKSVSKEIEYAKMCGKEIIYHYNE